MLKRLCAAILLPITVASAGCTSTSGGDVALTAAGIASSFDPTGISGMVVGVAEQAHWAAKEREAEERERAMDAQVELATAQARAACAADPKLNCDFLDDEDQPPRVASAEAGDADEPAAAPAPAVKPKTVAAKKKAPPKT